MSLNDLFPADKLIGNPKPAPEPPSPEVGAVDVNPFNYLAAAGQGALTGIFGKASDDLDDVQDMLGKKKKKKKAPVEHVEAEPEVVIVEKPVYRPRFLGRVQIGFFDRYKKYLIPAGAVVGTIAAVKLLKR